MFQRGRGGVAGRLLFYLRIPAGAFRVDIPYIPPANRRSFLCRLSNATAGLCGKMGQYGANMGVVEQSADHLAPPDFRRRFSG